MHKERLTIKPRLQSVSGRIYVARETGPPVPWPQLILLAVLGTAAIVSCSFLLYATDDDGAALLAPAPLLSIQSLGIARGLLFLILAHRIFLILFVRPPIDIKIDYQPGSQLKSMGSQVLAGVGRLATFTIQTWTLQTIYFGLVTLATLGYIQSYRQISYLFELLFATSHLVSCVTSYVLVPTMCKQWLKGDFGGISVSEIPLLGVDLCGNQPVRRVHFSTMTLPCWLRRASRNQHRHAIEQASHRWRGGRRDDSARTRRKI